MSGMSTLQDGAGPERNLPDIAMDLRKVFGRLRRKFREQSTLGDLTWSQLSVLCHLDLVESATVSELALREGVRSQSMGASIATMEAAGMVQRSPDPNDGRQSLVSLTPDCRQQVRAGRIARQDWVMQALQSKLSAEELAQLDRGIQVLKRLVED